MEKVYTNSDYSSQLLTQMLELWRGNKYCDAVLNLQDERLKLHKLVLMAACPNILRCLAHTEENNVFEFYLPEDIEKSAARLIVNYLYIGSIQLNMANVYGIEKLAKQLRLGTLSQFCHDFISLLESETFSQSLLQPAIDQENIPKQESTDMKKVVDPKAVEALNMSANATLTDKNNGTSSLSQSTDVFGQLPLASKSIKTEPDASISSTLEETSSKNQDKTITIEPLNNILQVSKSDNSMTTAFATSLCKSYDSSTRDPHLGSDRLELHSVSHQTISMGTQDPHLGSDKLELHSVSHQTISMGTQDPHLSSDKLELHSVSHQTGSMGSLDPHLGSDRLELYSVSHQTGSMGTQDPHLGSDRLELHLVSHQTGSMGTQDPQLRSSQISTNTSLTPVLSMMACSPSTSQSHGEEGDDIDLIMTAEDEDFEDSDNEWVPQGDESSDSDYCPESSLDRSTKTKRKMSTKTKRKMSTKTKRKMSTKGPKAKRSKKDALLTAKKIKVGGDKMRSEDDESKKTLNPGSLQTSKLECCSRFSGALKLLNVDLTGETEYANNEATNQTGIVCSNVAEEGSLDPSNRLSSVSPQMDELKKKSHCSEISAPSDLPDTEIARDDNTSTDLSMKHYQASSTEKSPADRKQTNCYSTSVDTDEEKRKQMEYKLQVVEHAQLQGVTSAAELYNITEDIIEDWIMLKQYFKKKTKAKGKKKAASNSGKLQSIKLGEHSDLEDKIVNWLLETNYSIGQPDDVNVVRNRAAEIAQEIGKPNLKIGELWVKQILERFISVTKINETGDVCTHELRKEVSKYATEHGTRAAAERYGLTTDIVGYWKRYLNPKTFGGSNSAEPSMEITRRRYTVNYKLEAVKCAEKLSNRAASRLYGVNESLVREWKKQKEELERSQGSQLKLQPVQTHSPYSLLESLLTDWIINEKRKITVAEIRAKALLIAEQTNSPEFKASHSWFTRFMKRHNLQEYVKLESSREENFVFEKRKEVAGSLIRDSHGRFRLKRGKEASFTNEFKLHIIEFAERSGNEEAEQQYGINNAIIRDWRVQKSSLLQRIRAKTEDREGET